MVDSGFGRSSAPNASPAAAPHASHEQGTLSEGQQTRTLTLGFASLVAVKAELGVEQFVTQAKDA